MREKTRPLTIRLPERDVEQLRVRAERVSGAPTAIARELILTGLMDGNSQAIAERLMQIERRLAAIDQQMQAIEINTDTNKETLERLRAMFSRLLSELTKSPISENSDYA